MSYEKSRIPNEKNAFHSLYTRTAFLQSGFERVPKKIRQLLVKQTVTRQLIYVKIMQ